MEPCAKSVLPAPHSAVMEPSVPGPMFVLGPHENANNCMVLLQIIQAQKKVIFNQSEVVKSVEAQLEIFKRTLEDTLATVTELVIRGAVTRNEIQAAYEAVTAVCFDEDPLDPYLGSPLTPDSALRGTTTPPGMGIGFMLQQPLPGEMS